MLRETGHHLAIKRAHELGVASRRGANFRVVGQWTIAVGGGCKVSVPRWQDTDDDGVLAINDDPVAENIGVPSEVTAPEFIGENGDQVGTEVQVCIRKWLSHRQADAQCFEEFWRHLSASHPSRRNGFTNRVGYFPIHGYRLERLYALAAFQVIGHRRWSPFDPGAWMSVRSEEHTSE